MPSDWIPNILVPAVLTLLMLIVGMDLTVEDFRRVARFPGTVLWVTVAQVLLLPPLAIALVLIAKPGPVIAIGMILTSVSPGGALSNYYVYLARANVALSITLTAISSLVSVMTIPPIASWSLALLERQVDVVQAPGGQIVRVLLAFVLAPICLGMLVRWWKPGLVSRTAAAVRRLSMVGVVTVVVATIMDQGMSIGGETLLLVALALAMTIASAAVGYGVGALFRRDSGDSLTLAFEFGARNLAIVALIGATALGSAQYVLFSTVFFLAQVPVVLGMSLLNARQARDSSSR